MREKVIAKHLGSHEERPATIDDETSVMTDNDGNKLDFRFWTYRRLDDPSPGLLGFLVAVLIIGLFAYWGARLI